MPPDVLTQFAVGPRSHSRHRRTIVAAGRAHALVVGRLDALTLSSPTGTADGFARALVPFWPSSSIQYLLLGHSSSASRRSITSRSPRQTDLPITYLYPLRRHLAGMRRPPSLGTYTSVRDPCLMSQYTAFSLNHADPVRAARVFLVLEYYPARDVSAYLGPISPMCTFRCCMHTA